MKKNVFMRAALLMLVLTLITSVFVGSTFAKYVTTVNSEDKARVAYWGFQTSNSMDLTGLFAPTYDGGAVDSVDDADVIAPGTSGSTTFSFAWDEEVSAYDAEVGVTGPEVKYNFNITVVENCDTLIKGNANILWALDATDVSDPDDAAYGTWDEMIAAIKALSGDASGSKDYAANTLPAEFTSTDDVHTISWIWVFSTDAAGDTYDTNMGNAAELDDVSINITITATQLDN